MNLRVIQFRINGAILDPYRERWLALPVVANRPGCLDPIVAGPPFHHPCGMSSGQSQFFDTLFR